VCRYFDIVGAGFGETASRRVRLAAKVLPGRQDLLKAATILLKTYFPKSLGSSSVQTSLLSGFAWPPATQILS
jgi:hypothetical protein